MKGLTLRARVVALLLFLSVIPPAVVAAVSGAHVRRRMRATDEARIAAMFGEFDAALDREGGDVIESLSAAAALLGREPALRVVTVPGGTNRGAGVTRRPSDRVPEESAARGAALAQEAGLDCLAALDNRGIVLWSAHAPATVGAGRPAWADVPAGSAVLVDELIEPGLGRVLTLQAWQAVGTPGATAAIAGGRLLDSAFLSRLSPGRTVRALLIDRDGTVLAASEPEHPLRPPRTKDKEGTFESDGVEHRFRVRPLTGPGGAQVGAVVAAVSLEPTLAAERAIRTAALVVAVTGTVLSAAAGGLLGRAVTRPLKRLEVMSGRVAAGRYDLLEAIDAPGEVGDLARAFTRMAETLRDSRERLVQAERRAAAEDVARRVAHEIKNPLSPIALTLEGLVRTRRLRPGEFDSAFEDAVRTIQEEVGRMRRVLEDFSRFGRLPPPHPRPTDLDGLVRRTVALHAETGVGARIETELEAGLPPVRLDADRITELLNNLIGNALQALDGGGGTVTIVTRREGEDVIVIVRDTGPGLSPEAQARLFEPYFSGRPGGTGLGLAISRRIVLDHGGTIDAGNREGGGAEIRVRLPLAGPPERAWPPS